MKKIIYFFSVFLLFFPFITPQERSPFDFEDQPPRPSPFEQPQYKNLKSETLNTILDDDTFEDFISDIKHNAILFLLKNDKNDKNDEFLKVFEETAKEIKKVNNEIIFSKIELKENSLLIKRYLIEKVPSYMYFYKSKRIPYFGKIDKKEFGDFIREIFERKIFQIENSEDFNRFYKIEGKSKVLAIYGEEMIKEKKVLEKLVHEDIFADSGNFIVGITHDQSIVPFPQDTEMPSLILYKELSEEDFDDAESSALKYSGSLIKPSEIISFCQLNSLPLIPEYTEDTAFRIFAGPVSVQLLLFLDPKKNNTRYLNEIYKAAKYNVEKELAYERIMFAKVNFNKENDEFINHFDVKSEQDLPKIFLTEIDNKRGWMTKYEYEKDEIDEEFIHDFLVDFRKKKLPVYYKSEKIPDEDEESKKPVRKLVGKMHDKETKRKRETVVVFYCSDEYPKMCKASYKYYEFYAKKAFETVASSKLVVFYYLDVTKNEAEYLDIGHIPTLKVFVKGEKKKAKLFQKEFNLRNIVDFINTQLNYEIDFTEQDRDDILLEIVEPEDREMILKAKEKQQDVGQQNEKQFSEGIEDDFNYIDDKDKDKNEENNENENESEENEENELNIGSETIEPKGEL